MVAAKTAWPELSMRIALCIERHYRARQIAGTAMQRTAADSRSGSYPIPSSGREHSYHSPQTFFLKATIPP
jgi:hypothetical protein